MKITSVKIRTVVGRMPAEKDKCDLAQGQRHRVPRDIALGYGAPYVRLREHAVNPDGTVTKQASFLYIETDSGIDGIAGPLMVSCAESVMAPIAAMLKGEDPLDSSRIWQLMYRSMVAPGPNELKAISAVDIALWDIRCKAAGLSLNKLLGGGVQRSLPAYASSVSVAFVDGSYDLEQVRDYVRDIAEEGYVGSKWWIHRGPSDGESGVDDMEALVKTIREAGGPAHKIMIDCWCGWSYEYAMRVCERIAPYDIYFLEEPLLPAEVDSVARLSRECPVRISLGEHLLGSYDFLKHINAGFRGIFQPDPTWCGGITETLKIMGLLTTHGYPVCLHASNVPLTTQLSALYPIDQVSMSEYLVNMMDRSQMFFKYPVFPEHGCLTPGNEPGCQMDIDESKADRDTVIVL